MRKKYKNKKEPKVEVITRMPSILHAPQTQSLISHIQNLKPISAEDAKRFPHRVWDRAVIDTLAGGDTRGSKPGNKKKYLEEARKYCFAQHSILLTAVKNVGLRRLTSAEMIVKGERNRDKSNTNERKDAHMIKNCVSSTELSPSDKQRREALLINLKGREIMSRPSTFQAQLQHIQQSNKSLPLGGKDGIAALEVLKRVLLEEKEKK